MSGKKQLKLSSGRQHFSVTPCWTRSLSMLVLPARVGIHFISSTLTPPSALRATYPHQGGRLILTVTNLSFYRLIDLKLILKSVSFHSVNNFLQFFIRTNKRYSKITLTACPECIPWNHDNT